MIRAIIELASKLIGLVIAWPQMKANKALKRYLNWRSGSDLKKDRRRRRADMLNDVDRLSKSSSSKLQ